MSSSDCGRTPPQEFEVVFDTGQLVIRVRMTFGQSTVEQKAVAT